MEQKVKFENLRVVKANNDAAKELRREHCAFPKLRGEPFFELLGFLGNLGRQLSRIFSIEPGNLFRIAKKKIDKVQRYAQ